MISFLIKDNEGISKFMEGNDSYIPISELQYLHTHPLLRPNFLTEIDDLIKEVGQKIIDKKISGKPIDELQEHAIDIGILLNTPIISEDSGRKILFSLRKIYKLCNKLKEKL